ncbi:MAG: tRNA (uridine(34)/cytosine(34)/5-carboxymethylaminomethyluridine(34)-2'-O)-methyltransferase TrmL [Clostridiales Family XIII bacterium]|jgi:tRNA (cytidine/uridine-2'-O-)-methyltransferase|nr:tRNA (uridine(34)/cytosine(34)/5-carboxymethylaminomethyluridine(34)-2'-O)-methyltransferase TrmL [Clostridiales Family XIII bacterium]
MEEKRIIKNNFHIVLVEPEIPPNTGNIARTCAATGTKLHLVKPLGFDIDDRAVKRAGLDYWPYVDLTVHDSFGDFLKLHRDAPLWFVSTQGKHLYTEAEYEDGAMFVFGRETKGLGREFIEAHKDRTIRIPMLPEKNLRSLNLSNSAAIVIYEALRHRGFAGM